MPLVITTSGQTTHTIGDLTIDGEIYRFKVRAENSIGKSVDSVEYVVIGASKPDPPTSFVRDEINTSKTQVAFSWSPPPDDGGSPVLHYTVEMDDNFDDVYDTVATEITLP